ncbi:MAG: apolipoprotein N-acyltransferase, partial [Calditrichia bacterium]
MDKKELTYIFGISALLALSFPPFPLGFLVPPALAVFIFFIWESPPKEAFRRGYWLGLIWGTMTLFWIASSTLTGALFAITINALHYAIIWWLFVLVKRRSILLAFLAFPFFWTGLEFLRLFSDIRFNWILISHTQTYYLPFIQHIEITGYLSLSFMLIVFAELLFLMVYRKGAWRWISPLGIAVPVVLLSLWGIHRIHQLDKMDFKLVKTGLVQPDVDPFKKWNPDFQDEAFEILMNGGWSLAAGKPDLVVWPETATPFYLRAHFESIQEIAGLLDSSRMYLLTGTPDYRVAEQQGERDYHTYNAAFFFRPDTLGFEYYYKMALVPAAESMPFKETFPILRKLEVGGGDFFPGKEYKIFKFTIPIRMGRLKNDRYEAWQEFRSTRTEVGLSAIICYESI